MDYPQPSRGYSPGRVSVIVPALRVDGFLKDCLESLSRQDYCDVEIVLVLDGARIDEDAERIVDLASRVVALPQRFGTPYALNVGIGVSTGEYVARLDADDLANPNRFSRQVAFLSESPEFIAIGSRCELIDSRGNVIGRTEVPVGSVNAALLRSNPLVHSSMMFRAEVLLDAGGYNLRCTRMQDYELFLRLAQLGPIGFQDECLTKYRLHEAQSSRRSPVLSYSTVAINRERRRLASSVGIARRDVALMATKWTGWQALRQMGLVRPGHSRSLDR